MKKKFVFLVIGIVMFVVMVIYLGYCVTHPTFLSPFGPLSITYIIYWTYFFTTIAMFIISIVLFAIDEKKK